MNNTFEFKNGEIPTNGYLLFKVYAEQPKDKLNLILAVIQSIEKFEEDNWPSDEEWNKILPSWFLNKIKNYSYDEILKSNGLLWDYGSWLDAMKYRGWNWYSSKVNTSYFDIILNPFNFPYSVNPLEYLIYETGIPIKNIQFFDYAK